MYKITKKADFEASHFIEGHKGKCINSHGHSYRVEVTIKESKLDELGMLIDFSTFNKILKEIVEPFDHAFVYNAETAEIEGSATQKKVSLAQELKERVVAFPGNTTAENMARYFFTQVKEALASTHPHIIVESVTVHEKEGNPATYTEE